MKCSTQRFQWSGLLVLLCLAALVGSGQWVFAASAPEARPQPIPDEKAQKEAVELVRDFFKADFARTSPQDRAALATRLLQEAQQTNTDLDLKFVLLREARQAAVDGGHVELALQVLDATGAAFKLDLVKEKADLLTAMSRSVKTPEAARNVAEACLKMAEEALRKAQYDEARVLVTHAETSSRTVKDDEWQKDATRRIKSTQELLREYDRVAAFGKTLQEKPDDPEANTAMGKFCCFVTDQWGRGLEMLAKGSDPVLKKMAQTELGAPAEASSQVQLGEEWWQYAKSLAAKPRFAVQSHAVEWLQKAMPRLDADKQEQITKTVIAFYTSASEQGLTPAAVQVGNVLLAKNGTTVARVGEGGALTPEHHLTFIDGVTTGYTGDTGYTYLSYPCAWVFTLPKPYYIREIRMLLWDIEPERFYRYVLETSMDGKTYDVIADCSKGKWRSWQSPKFAPRMVKYIRLKGLFNSVNQGFHVVELEAYCVPPATPVAPKHPSEPNAEGGVERKPEHKPEHKKRD